MAVPVYNMKVPEYNVRSKPDWISIGKKIDKKIKRYFLGKKVAIRCLGSQEHKGKSVTEIIKIIRRLGHDRYDSNKKGERYDNIENKKIDFFALDFKVKQDSVMMENFIEPFYTWPKKFGEKPVKIDIAIIYDLSKLRRVVHQYKGRNDVKRDGFVFKDQKNKRDALIGIIKILE